MQVGVVHVIHYYKLHHSPENTLANGRVQVCVVFCHGETGLTTLVPRRLATSVRKVRFGELLVVVESGFEREVIEKVV